MKLFQDIYIRPAGTRIDSIAGDGNLLEGWDRLDLPEIQGGFTLDRGKVIALGDGTDYVASEIHDFAAGSYKVSSDEFDYYRSTFHNVLVDIMLLDPCAIGFVEIGFGYRMQVVKTGELGDVRIMKLTARKEYAEGSDVPWRLIAAADLVLITGVVTDGADGSVLAGALVAAISEGATWQYETDQDGAYALFVQGLMTLDLKVDLAGYEPGTTGLTTPSSGEITVNFKLDKA